MHIDAYAKINLYLDVVSRKEDGYHELDMVTVPIELHDSLEFAKLDSPTSYVITDNVEVGELTIGKSNLVTSAINRMRNKFKFKENFRVNVHKEIPVRAGLGGGSSNAGAAIIALNKMLKLKASKEDLIDVAKIVGADVPFCTLNVPAHVKGIGEIIEPINVKCRYYVLIIMPKTGLNTKVVFEEADKGELSHSSPDDVIKALKTGDDELLGKSLFNSLFAVSNSLVPEIGEIINSLKKDGEKMVSMSGSGSAVFALSRDKNHLHNLSRKYDKKGYDTYISRILL